MFNSYHNPMNNGDNVGELGFRVGKIGEFLGTSVRVGEIGKIFGNRGFWVSKNRVNVGTWGFG